MNDKQHVQAFIASLPSGIKQDLETHYQVYGDMQPVIALRHWADIPIQGRSTPQWICDGYATSRQSGEMMAEAFHRMTGQTYEVWSLRPLGDSTGPHILNVVPALKTDPLEWQGERKPVTEDEISRFAEQWVIAHYGIHESNYQHVEVLNCWQVAHTHVWKCTVQFSWTGEQVELHMHSLPGGLHVFSLHYDLPGQEQ